MKIKIKELKGNFKVKAILHSDFVIENREKIIENITKEVVKYGEEIEGVRNNNLYIKNCNQFFRLPTISKERNGIINFRSKDFIFTCDNKESYCDKPKSRDITDNGFLTYNYKNEKTEWIIIK